MFRLNCGSAVAVVGAMALTLMLSSSASIRQRGLVAAFSHVDFSSTITKSLPSSKTDSNTCFLNNHRQTWNSRPGQSLLMSTSTPSSSASSETTIIPRVKTVDATEATDGKPVLIKGWVRTVRKQKTLAFVEVNDGSNMKGIQCVLSFDAIDEDTEKGTQKSFCKLF